MMVWGVIASKGKAIATLGLGWRQKEKAPKGAFLKFMFFLFS